MSLKCILAIGSGSATQHWAPNKSWLDGHIGLSLPNAKAAVIQWHKQNIIFMKDWIHSWQRLLSETSFWSTSSEICARSPLSWLTMPSLPSQPLLDHPTTFQSKEVNRHWNFVLSLLRGKCLRNVFFSPLPFSQLLHSGQDILYQHKTYISHTCTTCKTNFSGFLRL